MSIIKSTYEIAGDNIHTACAIARQCGILTPGGVALEGPEFRKMTPRQLDEVADNAMHYYLMMIRFNIFSTDQKTLGREIVVLCHNS